VGSAQSLSGGRRSDAREGSVCECFRGTLAHGTSTSTMVYG
jgi:hypothetical protein